MSEYRISIVTLAEGVDVDAFHNDMITGLASDANPNIPTREVEVQDYMPLSNRNIAYYLTQEEVATLKNDPRVVDVMWGTLEQNNIFVRSIGYYEDGASRLGHKTNEASGNSSEVNWALDACSNRVDPYVANPTKGFMFKNATSGNGVDIVIQDSGVDETHPEFLNIAGDDVRVKRVNWYQYLPTPSTLPTSYYTSLISGHGTHVASVAAGRTCGWARESHIISQRILIGADSAGINILTAFQLLRAWHNAKEIKRPTIVNMSWGYYMDYPDTPNASLGQVDTYHGVRVSAVESEIADCIADGIIFVSGAGNNKHKVDVVGGTDYDKSYEYFGSTFYYLQGSTPSATPGVICVGASDAVLGDKKATYSACGPRIDLYAPGSGIVAAWATGSAPLTGYTVFNYQSSSTYKLSRISGTSTASPQVAGVLANWLESNQKATASDARNWITSISTKNRIVNDAPNSYTNYVNLQGSANRFMYNGQFAFLVLKNFPATGVTVKNIPTFTP